MEDKIKQFLKTIKLNESLLSMIFGMVTVVLVGILVFRMYQANKPEITQEAAQEEVIASEKMGEVTVTTGEDGQKYPSALPEKYTVEKGDYLWAIAEKLYGSGYNWVDIAKENNLAKPDLLSEGQELKLPKAAIREVVMVANKTTEQEVTIEGEKYTVEKGDNLWEIAVRAYGDGYKWPEIARINEVSNPSYIEVGQELKLPR